MFLQSSIACKVFGRIYTINTKYLQLILRWNSSKMSLPGTCELDALQTSTLPICFISGTKCRMLRVPFPSGDDVSWLPSAILFR